jgi:hypothetical protein
MDPPTWAEGRPELWEAHHLIPVELQNHEVFEVLRNNGGWDHNLPENGIALPTRPGIPDAELLPLHQVTREAIAARREQINKARQKQGLPAIPMPDPQTIRDLAGHPVLNEAVKQRLDRLATMRLEDLGSTRLQELGAVGLDGKSPLIEHPDLLRQEVEKLQRELTRDILSGRLLVQL